MEGRVDDKDEIMNIGKVAKLAGVGVETIRFYERKGVLPKPKRKPSGYRQFDLETVARIRLIKKFQMMGFSLAQAGTMASLKGIPAAIERINRQIHGLQKLQSQLMKRHGRGLGK